MRKIRAVLISVSILSLMSACSSAESSGESEIAVQDSTSSVGPSTTTKPQIATSTTTIKQTTTTSTVAMTTAPAATQVPATKAPATQAPATQAPATQAPATQAPSGGGGGGGGGSGDDPRYSSCKDAKANGYGPYVRGVDPEYAWYQDRDGDGTVCE
jgi:hypothetical protein